MSATLKRAEPDSIFEPFLTFTKLALQGFGGVMQPREQNGRPARAEAKAAVAPASSGTSLAAK